MIETQVVVNQKFTKVNSCHIEAINDGRIKYLLNHCGHEISMWKVTCLILQSVLRYKHDEIACHGNLKFTSIDNFISWHEQFGHPIQIWCADWIFDIYWRTRRFFKNLFLLLVLMISGLYWLMLGLNFPNSENIEKVNMGPFTCYVMS